MSSTTETPVLKDKPAKKLSKKAKTALLLVVIACVAAACIAAYVMHSRGGASGGVAATVNGTEIKEQTVTDYIEQFRTSQSLDTEESWGTWLAANSLTPESVREEVINYFVDQELTKQAAAENDVTVSDDEVNEQVETMKANYGSDEAWNQALEQAGTTEDEYRESVHDAMLAQRLEEKVVSDVAEPTDEELLTYVQNYAPYFNGAKRSSHILFSSDDEATAQQVLDQINNGEISFEDAAKQYSTDTASAENGGDVGWDLLNNFVTEYSTALSNLEEGQVSDLVTSDYGIHIIKCTEVFQAPDDITSTDQVPSEMVDYIKQMLVNNNESTAYSEWKEDYKSKADIQINDMPKDLPYDIDMSAYETDDSTSTDGSVSTDATTDGTSVESTGSTDATDGTSVEVTTEDGSASGDASSSEADSASAESSESADASQGTSSSESGTSGDSSQQ